MTFTCRLELYKSGDDERYRVTNKNGRMLIDEPAPEWLLQDLGKDRVALFKAKIKHGSIELVRRTRIGREDTWRGGLKNSTKAGTTSS